MNRAAANRAAALSAAVAILILVLRFGPARRDLKGSARAAAESSPVEFVERFLGSARRGDVAAYLESLGGALRDRVQRDVEETGREPFAARLRETARASLSHAVFAPEPSGRGDLVAIAVDAVQADRQVRSVYQLEPSNPGWRIVAVDASRELFPEATRGAVATYQSPEANPMSGGQDLDAAIGEAPQ